MKELGSHRLSREDPEGQEESMRLVPSRKEGLVPPCVLSVFKCWSHVDGSPAAAPKGHAFTNSWHLTACVVGEI